ncbi:hypothetical protein BJ508DRAFT_417385 [Ascobolus immersus RN42]|uniref:Uncharacterized protein n=1 Tax=Ascobolus immersus RN42 TaxID=1160509 RepID=A0A3N4HT50_ASCIM|nr:hypothetical protein BJ508DRAFT_417385 [Ascobolus immersus RN42]
MNLLFLIFLTMIRPSFPNSASNPDPPMSPENGGATTISPDTKPAKPVLTSVTSKVNLDQAKLLINKLGSSSFVHQAVKHTASLPGHTYNYAKEHPYEVAWTVFRFTLIANPLGLAGFSGLGPVAGSAAAAYQSTCGDIAAHSLFAGLQSIGMTAPHIMPILGSVLFIPDAVKSSSKVLPELGKSGGAAVWTGVEKGYGKAKEVHVKRIGGAVLDVVSMGGGKVVGVAKTGGGAVVDSVSTGGGKMLGIAKTGGGAVIDAVSTGGGAVVGAAKTGAGAVIGVGKTGWNELFAGLGKVPVKEAGGSVYGVVKKGGAVVGAAKMGGGAVIGVGKSGWDGMVAGLGKVPVKEASGSVYGAVKKAAAEVGKAASSGWGYVSGNNNKKASRGLFSGTSNKKADSGWLWFSTKSQDKATKGWSGWLPTKRQEKASGRWYSGWSNEKASKGSSYGWPWS